LNQFTGSFPSTLFQLPHELVNSTVRLQIWRLFTGFEGLLIPAEMEGQGQYSREMVVDQVFRVEDGGDVKEKPWCGVEDFGRTDWSGGYWYRNELTDEAWEYRLPHCRTRRFSLDEASECLNGRWMGYIGDSTTQGKAAISRDRPLPALTVLNRNRRGP
jgi:hypothetical protein